MYAAIKSMISGMTIVHGFIDECFCGFTDYGHSMPIAPYFNVL